MAFPVTLNGRTYTLADFEGQNYAAGFPDALQDFVTDAGTSVTAAAASATAAAASETAAAASAAAAAASVDAIEGFYLGAQASNPTVDLNGAAVTVGDFYFNTATNQTRIYNGSSWDVIAPDLVGDSTPQLGGTLDFNGNIATSFESTGIDDNATSTAITIDASENVGIGNTETFQAGQSLSVGAGSSNSGVTIYSGTASQGRIYFGDATTGAGQRAGQLYYDHSNDSMFIATGGDNPRVTVDSSGNVLVGTTDTLPGIGDTNAGISMSATNGIIVSRNNDAPINMNRNTSDGILSYFRKDGVIVGGIGTDAGDIYFGSGATATERTRITSSGKLLVGTSESGAAGKLIINGDITTGRASTTTGDYISSGGGFSSAYNGIALMSNCDAINAQSNTSLSSWIVDIGGRAADGSTFPTSTSDSFSIRRVAAGGSPYSASTYLKVDSSGRAGIGTTDPQQKMHVDGGGLQIDGNISTPASGQTGVLIDYFSDGARFWSRGTASARGTFSFIQLENDGGNQQTAMFIDTSGNLLVGKTNTGSVNDGAHLGTSGCFLTAASTAPLTLRRSAAGIVIQLSRGGVNEGTLTMNTGAAPTLASGSDIRLKENVTEHCPELENILSIKTRQWDWKDKEKGAGEGVVAQELETIYPDLVFEDNDGMLNVKDFGPMTTRLIKAMQEQQAMIEELKAEVAALKGA